MKLGLGLSGSAGGAKPDVNILVIGQSLGNLMFNDPSFTNPTAGIDALRSELKKYFGQINVINAARNGIAIMNENAGAAGSYLAADETSKSMDYTALITNGVSGAGLNNGDIDFIIQIIGNTDASGMDDGTPSVNAMKSAMSALKDNLLSDFTHALYGIIPLGADLNSNQFTGFLNFGKAEYEFIRDNTDALEMPSYLAGPFKDDTHLSEAGAIDFWPRVARRIAGMKNRIGQKNTLGPRISGIDFDIANNLIFLSLEFDGTTHWSVGNEPKHFVFDINGALYNPAFVVKDTDDPSRVRTRPNGYTIQSGDIVRVEAMTSNFKGLSIEDILKDGNNYPCRPVTDIEGTV